MRHLRRKIMSHRTWSGLAVTALIVASTVGIPAQSASAAARTCFGRAPTIVGTTGKNVIHGTPKRDVIVGLGGKDTIRGGGGNDFICGDGGGDKLFGGKGDDRISGSMGSDR